jgi:FlaA1/EpsC-like NDP-sugar epimerase
VGDDVEREQPSDDGYWRRVRRALAERRGPVQAAIDILAWAVALPAAMFLRYEFAAPSEWGPFSFGEVVFGIALVGAIQVVVGATGGLYRGRWRFGSFDEVAHLVGSVFIATVAFSLLNRFGADRLGGRLVPHSVTIVAGVLALLAMAGARYLFRLHLERRLRPDAEATEKVLVFGAGEGGIQLVTSMLRNPASPYLPVGLLDDNPLKGNLEVMGIPVVGTRDHISVAADRTGASTLVIAIPSAGSELLRELSQLALESDLDVRVLPALSEMLGGAIGLSDLRPITVADLLGRHEIQTDLDSISHYLTGRRVLVTGAGGSIGSELCYQISRFAPASLVMLDRDESALHGVQLRLHGRATLDDRSLVVCDIRDPDRLSEMFAEHQPEVVFHAAALKHLPLLEMHPVEAVKTNVYGTLNLLRLSVRHGVERFVNISTDKAADPTSVLGYSKRLAERLTSGFAQGTSGTYLSVRFGNVLGSRGSVLTAFHAQVEAGGPITVTDPEVTRYFMTVEEAVQLVVQAGAVGQSGEALVLDMGSPVRIEDVARRYAAQSDRRIEIVYTGLRPGEKLHEVLFGSGEIDRRPAHPLVSHVNVPALDADTVLSLSSCFEDDDRLVAELRRLTTPATGQSANAVP